MKAKSAKAEIVSGRAIDPSGVLEKSIASRTSGGERGHHHGSVQLLDEDAWRRWRSSMRARGVSLVVALAVSGVALTAHHSVAVTYDTDKLVSLAGVIQKVEVVNPHVKLDLESTGEDGAATTWTMEMAPPGGLKRKGFDFELIRAGQRVVIESWLRKDGKKEANGRTLVLKDGRRFDVADPGIWFAAPATK